MTSRTHRTLTLTSPHTKGADVKSLQHALNRRSRAMKLHVRVDEDGIFGPDTSHAAQTIAYLLGVNNKKIGAKCWTTIQRVIKTPALRGAFTRRRGRKRLAAYRKHSGAAGAVAHAISFLHTAESGGDNNGRQVNEWERIYGLSRAPWCGVFVGNMLRLAGLIVAPDVVSCPSIVAHAKAGTGGWAKWVSWAERQEGDAVLFDWEGDGGADHVGMYIGKGQTIEGNTSLLDGSGREGVEIKRRSPANILGCARPRWE